MNFYLWWWGGGRGGGGRCLIDVANKREENVSNSLKTKISYKAETFIHFISLSKSTAQSKNG